MADLSHLTDAELEQIALGQNNSQYNNYSNTQLENIVGDSQGAKGIGQDILSGIRQAPSALFGSIKQLPGELFGASKQIVTNPIRVAQNLGGGVADIGHGLLSTPGNIRDYLAEKGIVSENAPSWRLPESVLPKEQNYQEALGRRGQEKGDALLSSVPAALEFGALGELGGAAKLARLGKRVGAGALYGIAENQNPITAGIVNAALPKALETVGRAGIGTAKIAANPLKSAKNVSEQLIDKISNMVLNKASKDIESGGSLSPEETAANLEKNYTNIKGNQMPVDLGTLTNNKFLKSLYSMSTKVPFSKGAQLVSQFERERALKGEHEATEAQNEQLKELNQRKFQEQAAQDYATRQLEDIKNNENKTLPGINSTLSHLEPYQEALQSHITEVPNRVNELRHPEIPHAELLKNETQKAYQQAKQESSKLYDPVNKFDLKNLNIDKHTDFPKYLEGIKNLHLHAENLREMFGTERDIGNKAAIELDNALNFIRNKGSVSDIGALREHIQNLQRIGAQLTENGHRVEGSRVSSLGRDLKDDLKNKLRDSGYSDVADQLENADQHYINQVLPFYKNKTIRETSTSSHIPEPVSYSKLLYNPNNANILKRLSLPAQNATAFETLTKGKYGNEPVNLTPEQINKNYASLPFNSRQAFESFNPELNYSLSSLPRNLTIAERLNTGINEARQKAENLTNESQTQREKAFKLHEKASENLKNLNKEEQVIKDKIEEIISKKFGKPEIKKHGIGAFLNNLSPVHAAGVGFALAPFIGPFASGSGIAHLVELGLLTVPVAKAVNEALTRPELVKHYIQGTKFTKNIKPNAVNLKSKINQGLSSSSLGLTNEKRKPMELLLTKGVNSK